MNQTGKKGKGKVPPGCFFLAKPDDHIFHAPGCQADKEPGIEWLNTHSGYPPLLTLQRSLSHQDRVGCTFVLVMNY